MANSDNVLRGGLTSKHIDVKELIENVRFEDTLPLVVQANRSRPHQEVYLTEAPDFELSQIELASGESILLQASSVEMFLVMDGQVDVQPEGQRTWENSRGQAFVCFAGAALTLVAKKQSRIFRAVVPLK